MQRIESRAGSILRTTAVMIVMAIGASVFGCTSKEVNYTPEPGHKGAVISHFSFSRMVIDGTEFNDVDVVIGSDGKSRIWQIGSVHVVDAVDIRNLVDAGTRILIIGTGTDGVTQVMPEALSAAKQQGIELHVLDSMAAVNLFNRMDKEGLVAAFHTGC